MNRELFPSTSLEINIDAIGEGSFRFRLSPKQKELLQSAAKEIGKDIKSLILMVLAAVIAGKILASDANVNVEVNNDITIITGPTINITVPSDVYAHQEKLVTNESLDARISEFFTVLDRDESIENFGLISKLDSDEPDVKFDRSYFSRLRRTSEFEEETGKRTKIERTNVHILRAWLERGKHLWQFAWRSVKISAPILDDSFYDRMASHEILIGTGDALDVELRINQVWNDQAKIWVNENYIIEKVYDRIEAIHQEKLV